MHGTRRFRTRQTRETRAALQGGHDAVPQRRSYGLSTPLPAVASPRVFVPEVVYCGGGTTRLKIRSADLDALLKPRLAAVAERG